MQAVLGDADVMRFGPGPQSSGMILRWLEARIGEYDELGFGRWALTLIGSDHLIGYCGLTLIRDLDGRDEIELGYRLAKPFWGRGFATEAAIAARDHAFQSINRAALTSFGRVACGNPANPASLPGRKRERVDRLIALIDPANTASIRVAEKVGMVYEKDVMLEGYTHPDRVYVVERPAQSSGR